MSQVVIGDILPRTQATATSGQTVFGTNWTANAASDVVVYRTPVGDSPNDATQVLSYPSQYSVAFIGSEQEVQVTLVSGATLGDIVTVTRQTPADRMNLYSNTNFLPSMLNNDFGILTLVDQQAQLVDQQVGPRYNYSAIIVDIIDTILPILGANQAWVKNSGNTAIIPLDVPAGGIAPADATYVTQNDQTSTLPNSFRLIGGTNVTLTTGTNTLTISMTGQSINPGTQYDLAYYATSGTVISPLATANDGVLITSGSGVPSISSTLPLAVQANITQVGTITTGVWNGTAIDLAHGGTNANLTASNGGIFYSTATAGAILSGTATANLPLLSGSSTAPIWAPFALSLGGALTTAGALTTVGAFGVTFTFTNTTGVTFPTTGTLATTSQLPTPSALTKTDDTNVTLTLGGSPNTALLAATSLTLGWTGQLSVARGGTGLAAITAHDLIIGNGTSAPNLLAPSATVGVPLISQGAAADPIYGTALVAGGGTGNTTFTAYSVICAGTTATGAFQNVSGIGSSGQVLTSQGAGALPQWTNAPGTGTVNSGTINYLTYYAATGTTVSGLTTPTTGTLTAASGVPTWLTLPAITQINTQIFTSTGAYTYTPTPGTKYITMELQGGGGGSGGSTGAGSQSAVSGAGGGGAYIKLLVTAANIGASITGNVGAGGTAGASGNNAGGAGGNTTAVINSSTWTASGGGAGGGQAAAAVTQVSGTAGTGGTTTAGANATTMSLISGASGNPGFSSGATIPTFSGSGGRSQLGSGGAGLPSNSAANGGGAYGGGAAGGSNGSGGSIAGAAGGNGIVIVTEYISI